MLESLVLKLLPKKEKSLEKELILVTGAALGLGRAVVLNMAKRYKPVLVLWDVNEVDLRKTSEECRKVGAKTHCYVVDLTNHRNVVEAADKVRREVGCITVLYNNAGFVYCCSYEEADLNYVEQTIRVNLFSYMWTIREFLPGMIERGSGHLVSTCSAAGFLRFSYITSYVASKYGIRGFLESLKLEMRIHPKKANIKFSTVYPGWMKTGMTAKISWEPRYRCIDALLLMDCEKVAEKVVDGIAKEREEIMIPQYLNIFATAFWFLPTKCVDSMERHLYKDMRVTYTTNTTNPGMRQTAVLPATN